MAQWAKCLLLLAQEPKFESPEPTYHFKKVCVCLESRALMVSEIGDEEQSLGV